MSAMQGTLTKAKVDRDVRSYRKLLDEKKPERALQEFLNAHAYFFHGLARHHSPIYSRVKLGTDYETDYAFMDPNSYGADWHFIEIESPKQRLFTLKGDPTAALTHAVEQVRDWNRWLHEHLEYARRLLPLVEYPLTHAIMGRRQELNDLNKKKLRRLNFENRSFLQVRTLDFLAESALRSVAFGSTNEMQLRCYTHAQLAKREPAEVLSWLTSQHASIYKQRRKDGLLRERTEKSLDDAPAD
jgi:hypothetical protein